MLLVLPPELTPDKAGVISFVVDGISSEDVGDPFNRNGIGVRSGHHRTQPIRSRFDLGGTASPSLAFYNACDEIDVLIAVAVIEVRNFLLSVDRPQQTNVCFRDMMSNL